MHAEVKDASSAAVDIPAKGLQVKPEHKAEWVRRFHESGSSYAKFSAIFGLRVATLRSWVEKEWEARQRTVGLRQAFGEGPFLLATAR